MSIMDEAAQAQQEYEAEREAEREAVRNFTLDDLITHLQNSLRATDIILGGYQQAGGFHDDSSNILFMAIIEHRQTIENTIDWLDANIGDLDLEIENEIEKPKKIKSAKKKMVVEAEEDSDEL